MSKPETMKAYCFSKIGKIDLIDVEKPKILKPTDVIGKVLKATICGTDLHIVDGHMEFITVAAGKRPGRGLALGHEAIVKVIEVGSAVEKFKVGDVAIASCCSSCGHCFYCQKNIQAHCINSEGLLGCYLGAEIDGFHAEYTRIPFADHSIFKVPEGQPLEPLLLLSDILPTSYEVGVKGKVEESDSVAVIGLGPVGLCILLTLSLFQPSQVIAIDLDERRLELAKKR
ncbi:unnamed protein product [Ambrosiozyma monospora]|uniref:Unnamed protein product n=1 Tax=Ambrosiozyma monospora TaxID=43982 RepID=A0ACB5TTJ8_AMBMO|nr:unnamed protein product [Ambrosiozyma monospora]